MKKTPARFVTVKSIVVNGPVGFCPMRPRPRHSIPIETATADPKANLKRIVSKLRMKECDVAGGKGVHGHRKVFRGSSPARRNGRAALPSLETEERDISGNCM
jgi:hypothetical protein